MKVKVLNESGYDESMIGLSLSWASNPERAKEIAKNLAHKTGGHNKFIESIYLWIDITAPRFWWSEADTYRLSTKQSASTMHTIAKQLLTQENFEYPIFEETLKILNSAITNYQVIKDKPTFLFIKNNLPEGFLQRRIWVMNYAVLQNIYRQRINHKLPQWQYFLNTILSELQHPEFITQ